MKTLTRLGAVLALSLSLLPVPTLAQNGPSLAFGSAQEDKDAPVEVEADNLSVNQTDGTAEFTGNVMIRQGEMKLSAPRVLVRYSEDQSDIERLEATGGITLVSGEDAAEAERADYDIAGGTLVLTGDAVIVQGANTLSSDRMTIDLNTGQAQMEGRVRTLLKTGNKN